MPAFRLLIALVLALPLPACPATRIETAAAPGELKSTAFWVTANGPVNIAITARAAGFWDRGFDIQPWRLGLRPVRGGQTIRFRLTAPAELSISRPGDFLNHAAMLFVFAGSPPPPTAGPKVTIIAAGIHRPSLNPKTGDTIYLAPGAFVFGSHNLFNVSGIRVPGWGTIVYEGSQDPNRDEGWMQIPDWHCIGFGECTQRRDRWADLHRACADLVDPEEGLEGFHLRRPAGDRRQSGRR